MISLDGVTKTYPDGPGEIVALDHFSLRVDAGELVALVGPSGSGKTTALEIAGAFTRPTQGTVTLGEREVHGLAGDAASAVRRELLGFVMQEADLLPELTTLENVALASEIAGAEWSDASRLAHEALESCGLTDLGHRFPDELSGGQRMRAAVARAIVGDRPILVADEPTASLDSRTSTVIGELLRMRASQGGSVLVATHDTGLAALADRTFKIRDGRTVE